MNWWGKIVGSGFGLLSGPLGGIIGASIGHWFDEGKKTYPNDEKKALLHYYAYFFSCAAKIAKADGGISSKEIDTVQSLIDRMKLTGGQQSFAKSVFRKAKTSSTSIREDFKNSSYLMRENSTMSLSFLGGMYEIACSEKGKPSELQLRCLLMGENLLKLPTGTVRKWLEGEYVPTSHTPKNKRSDDHYWAYRMLGVSEITTNAEIKGEYRKKMALLHPDKLMGKNLPAELIVFTNEQASLLNEAYQLIRKTRGFK